MLDDMKEMEIELREAHDETRELRYELNSLERELTAALSLVSEYEQIINEQGCGHVNADWRTNNKVNAELTEIVGKGREFLKIEKAIDENENVAEAWQKFQMILKLCKE